MQQRGSRLESDSFTATEGESFHSELSEAGSPLLDSVARGKDAISAVTAEAMNSVGSDLTALRADLNGLKDGVPKFYITGEQRSCKVGARGHVQRG